MMGMKPRSVGPTNPGPNAEIEPAQGASSAPSPLTDFQRIVLRGLVEMGTFYPSQGWFVSDRHFTRVAATQLAELHLAQRITAVIAPFRASSAWVATETGRALVASWNEER